MVNIFTPKQIGRHFADTIFMCIFMTKSIRILIQIWLQFVSGG